MKILAVYLFWNKKPLLTSSFCIFGEKRHEHESQTTTTTSREWGWSLKDRIGTNWCCCHHWLKHDDNVINQLKYKRVCVCGCARMLSCVCRNPSLMKQKQRTIFMNESSHDWRGKIERHFYFLFFPFITEVTCYQFSLNLPKQDIFDWNFICRTN